MKWRRARKPDKTFSSYTPMADFLRFIAMQDSGAINVNRTTALSVPAVQRGRNMLCSIGTIPLVQRGPDNTIAPSSLLAQLDPDVSNVVTLSQTIEDLLFDGLSWWLITAQDFAGFPVSVRHLDIRTVSLQPPGGRNVSPLPSGIDPREGVVYVDGKPVDRGQIIRFDSPNPGVLTVGLCAIRRALLLDKAANMYADDPRPLDYFTPTGDSDPVDDDEVKQILADWKAARKARSTGYVPAALIYNSVNSPSPAELQLVELQRQAGLEIANALGIDPEDLGISTTSRTYSNDVDRRRNQINNVFAPFMRAITDRLSMGDVTRRGYTVRFDTTEYLQPNPTERWATYQTALAMGAITVPEIREKEGMPPLPATAEPVPESQEVAAHRQAQRTFAESGLTFMDLPVMEFSVNREGRTIEGLVLPYGKTATQGGLKFRFNKGALQWDAENPGRVKLLRDHDFRQPLGKAIQLKDTSRGMVARFKVAQGAAGDEALQLADDGVLDGLSVGVDFDIESDVEPDPKNKNVLLVNRADWRETSLTAMPSFDDARVTSVAASRTQGETNMPETTEATEPQAPAEASVAPAAPAQTFSQDDVRALVTEILNEQPERETVDPTRPTGVSFVNEALPYRFDGRGRFQLAEHDFATDVVDMMKRHDFEGVGTDSGKRVMDTLKYVFSIVSTGDASPLNPTLQRPDLFAGPKQFKTPIWDMIDKGALPNSLQPFTFPILPVSGSSIVVSGHSEGVEPPAGDAIWQNTTVTPTALSGKTTITREVWNMGGNPAVSSVLMDEFLRSWFEGLETASATFLNTLTAATDINLGAGVFHTTLANNWNAALAGLQFARSYNFSSFALEQWLYTSFSNANDETGGTGKGRPLYPIINPVNADGTADSLLKSLNLGGVVGIPCWALTAVSGSANNSWLFDADYVHGWASGPERLEFAGSSIAGGGYAPLANIDIGVFGYRAFVCRDISAVRQVIYDNT